MLPSSSTLSFRIRFLLDSLDDFNYDSVFQELYKYTSHGVDTSILVLQTCFNHLNVYGKDLKNMDLHPLYASIFRNILDEPNFSTVFNESLRLAEINEEVIQNLCGAFQLSLPEKIAIGLALSDSENVDVRKCGRNFCMAQIAELCANPAALVSTDLIQQTLMFLNHSESLSKHVDSFMQMLSLMQLKEGNKSVLAPFLPDEVHKENGFRNLNLLNESDENDFDAILAEMEKEISMAGVVSELGYGCTANVSQCKEVLSLFLPLSEITVAKILGTVIQTYSGLDDHQNVFTTFLSALSCNSALEMPSVSGWNADILVDSIKQLAPGINWISVIEKLDQEGFYVPNESAFAFFMSIYRYACQDPFPVHAICGFVWKNIEGQLSFLKYAVSVPPKVFTFAHSGRQLNYDEAMSSCGFEPGQLNCAWSCLDVLEVLCQLAERGHAKFVRSILESPLHYCPELLLLGMSHVKTAYNLIQLEVTSAVMPMILKKASVNSLILNLWHVNRNLLLRGFTDVINFDPNLINRILDTCLELKILSPILDMISSYFGVRLAAVASWKKLIDLDSWLTIKSATYADAFNEECFKFLKEVQSRVYDISTDQFNSPDALYKIYLEACPTFVKVLQSLSDITSYEEIEKMNTTFARAISRAKNAEGSGSTSSDIYADDVEAEANSYFHEMFSDQLTTDDIVVKLARFKDSSEKREKSIFDCMIGNLIEEYKFLSKYPEKQLKTAAVLFGSLINKQIMTDLTLGVALRAVLDALRKPADSKMFTFGCYALEEFMDRLKEWPQYCNHILQVSHWRTAHPVLVAFIERTLAEVSATRAEPDYHNTSSNHQNGIVQSSAPHIEISHSLSSLTGPGSSDAGTVQVSSPIHPPQILKTSLDGSRTSTPPSNYIKPASLVGQHASAPSSDTSSIQKAHTAVGLPSVSSSSSGFPRSARGFGSALNIETLVAAAERRETPIEAPTSEVQDKISFIVNNLSTTNIEAKAKELSEILNAEHFLWFAQYMVMKRASIEPNFHDLYLKFFEKVNLKSLNKEIIKATYENCKVLLGSELIKSSVEERSLLKSLGSWLGKLTIAKNQVLRSREIDPKSLIIQAYERGLMIAVIPFTSKILESCSSSLAYKPPNPWTMAILGLLAEIYAMPNLKMNLKFDIEVLFKNLGVDLNTVAPTSLLVEKFPEVEGNPDFSKKDTVSLQPSTINEVKQVIISKPSHIEQSHAIAHAGDHMRTLPQAIQVFEPAPNIEHQMVVNKELQTYGLHIPVKSALPIVMDSAVNEIVSSIVQRSVSVATQTTKELVLKDYAIEPDESLIQNAAHLMVAKLAGSLAHVTCKELLQNSISSKLRTSLKSMSIPGDILERTVKIVTDDNLDLGCVLIEQAATEKAIQTIDGEIALSLDMRRKHREMVGSTFLDSPKPSQLPNSHQRVYEEFARLPGANQSSQLSSSVYAGFSASSGLSQEFESGSGPRGPDIYSSGFPNDGLEAVPQILGIASEEIGATGSHIPPSGSPSHFDVGDSSGAQIPENRAASSLSPNSTRELEVSGTAQQPTNATSVSELLSEPLLTTGHALDVYQTVSEVAVKPGSPESSGHLVDIAWSPPTNDVPLPVMSVANDKGVAAPGLSNEDCIHSVFLDSDPVGFDDQVSQLFVDWYQIYELPGANEATCARYVLNLNNKGLLKGDEISGRLFRKIMEISVAHCLSSEVISSNSSHLGKSLSFLAIDIYAKLVFSILKFCPVDQGSNKPALMTMVLAVTVKFIQKDAEEKKTSFNPRPYFRLFVNWIFDLCSLDSAAGGGNFEVLASLATALHAVQPLVVPAFSFAWLELMSHRSFMPKLLTSNGQKGWPFLQRLLLDLFQFLEPSLRSAELAEPVLVMYKGTLRVLLVLLHDFPEFLGSYHFSFLDVIPQSCIQMRNIILSAFPRTMRLLDPSTPNLKIDLLPECQEPPLILSDVEAALRTKQIVSDVDEYIKTRQHVSPFLSELKQKLLLSPTDAARVGTRYNVPLINSLVLYTGMQAMKLQPRNQFSANSAVDIFQGLVNDLDTEGRYLFLSAMANNLRYPNSHTHYFSFVILYLFKESKQEVIQEQITRVLLERLIALKPLPWGLLITFTELTKNNRYNFWKRSYIRAPELESLFTSVSRTYGPKPDESATIS